MGRILIAGESGGVGSSMAMLLRADDMVAQEVQEAASVVNGVEADLCDLLLINLTMQSSDPFDLISRCSEADPDIPILAVAKDNSVDEALTACERGAFDYLTTPINPKLFTQTIHRWLDQEGQGFSSQSSVAHLGHEFRLPHIIAESTSMQAVCERILRLGPAEISVSLLGKHASGRSAVARSLHELSSRKEQPMVIFDCEKQGEEVLLGTLATERKRRRSEESVLLDANHGTLYMQNAEHLSPRSQEMILEVINERAVSVPGGDSVPVDVRMVFSFGIPLRELRERGMFSEELMNRVSLAVIKMPEIQERRSDILPLISMLLSEADGAEKELEYTISSVGAEMLERYAWPGGMQQFISMVEDDVLPNRELFISADLLPEDIFDQRALENPVQDDKGPYAYRNLIEFLHSYGDRVMTRLQHVPIPS